jgi:hypothetical protein
MTETKSVSTRLPLNEIAALKKEAKANYRTFASYLEMLIMTHPERKKK